MNYCHFIIRIISKLELMSYVFMLSLIIVLCTCIIIVVSQCTKRSELHIPVVNGEYRYYDMIHDCSLYNVIPLVVRVM